MAADGHRKRGKVFRGASEMVGTVRTLLYHGLTSAPESLDFFLCVRDAKDEYGDIKSASTNWVRPVNRSLNAPSLVRPSTCGC